MGKILSAKCKLQYLRTTYRYFGRKASFKIQFQAPCRQMCLLGLSCPSAGHRGMRSQNLWALRARSHRRRQCYQAWCPDDSHHYCGSNWRPTVVTRWWRLPHVHVNFCDPIEAPPGRILYTTPWSNTASTHLWTSRSAEQYSDDPIPWAPWTQWAIHCLS